MTREEFLARENCVNKIMMLCVNNDYFTCGTNRQYTLMLNWVRKGFSIGDIVNFIYICSDTDKVDRDQIAIEVTKIYDDTIFKNTEPYHFFEFDKLMNDFDNMVEECFNVEETDKSEDKEFWTDDKKKELDKKLKKAWGYHLASLRGKNNE